MAAFEHRLEDNLLYLQKELRTKNYYPGSYVNFFIHEPKRRLISAAPFRDRVTHHALCNLIEPIFEKSFVKESFANRMGKGTHRALDQCQKLSRRFPYFLPCDIKQFFPSIDHSMMKEILSIKVQDPDVLRLVDHILRSGSGVLSEEYNMVYFKGDDLFAMNRDRGLPIGNLTSQFWANCYLNSFDHFVKRELRCKGYVRYVDDFLLFAEDKKTLWAWKKAVEGRLASLRLSLHSGIHPKPVEEGIPFLGFNVFPNKRRLKKRKGIHFQRKLRSLAREFSSGKTPLKQVNECVGGWVNHVRYGNTVGLRKAVLRQTFFTSIHKGE